MRIRISAAAAVGSVLVLGVAACSSSASGASGSSGSTGSGAQQAAVAGPGSGAGKTLTVWYMDGDLSDAERVTVTGLSYQPLA